MNTAPAFVDRFNRKWMPEPNTGCWLWLGALTSGRPGIKVMGRIVFAHRFSHAAFNGPISKGLYVCHRCNTPMCVNPDHLYAGTPQQNSDDMVRAGRHAVHQHPSTKPRLLRDLAKLHDRFRSQTHCKRGHELSGDNLYVNPQGSRKCITCLRASQARWYQRKKAAKS